MGRPNRDEGEGSRHCQSLPATNAIAIAIAMVMMTMTIAMTMAMTI